MQCVDNRPVCADNEILAMSSLQMHVSPGERPVSLLFVCLDSGEFSNMHPSDLTNLSSRQVLEAVSMARGSACSTFPLNYEFVDCMIMQPFLVPSVHAATVYTRVSNDMQYGD